MSEWDKEYVLRKRPTSAKDMRTPQAVNAALRSGNIEVTKKIDRKNLPSQEIAETTDIPEVKFVLKETAMAIQKGRQTLGLSQKDLAQKINEKVTVVTDYEQCKVVPNGQIISKIERALKIHIRGPKIGHPL